MSTNRKFRFSIDRGGTFTDVFAKCPNGKIRVLKLLSEDPQHYRDAPTEGIRRILEEIIACVYEEKDASIREEYSRNEMLLKKICENHIKYGASLKTAANFSVTFLSTVRATNKFVKTLPVRDLPKNTWILRDLRRFLPKFLENDFSNNLNGWRLLSVQCIRLILGNCKQRDVKVILNKLYGTTSAAVLKRQGTIYKTRVSKRNIIMLTFFGLEADNCGLATFNALKSSDEIKSSLNAFNENPLENTSIAVTYGLVYCGVFGHPFRKEYIISGDCVRKAVEMSRIFPNKITCSYMALKTSSMSSSYFHLLESSMECTFEFNDYQNNSSCIADCSRPLGQNSIMSLISLIIKHPDRIGYHGICLRGEKNVGITTIISNMALEYRRYQTRLGFAWVDLFCGSNIPYFCVCRLYEQLYDGLAKNGCVGFNFPRYLWDFNEVLQVDPRKTLQVSLEMHSRITKNFVGICQANLSGLSLLFVDNVQHIDERSLDVLKHSLLSEKIGLVCGGHFDKAWDTMWALSMNSLIKVVDLQPVSAETIPSLLANFLDVDGVELKLSELVAVTCRGFPGRIKYFVSMLIQRHHVKYYDVPASEANSRELLVLKEKGEAPTMTCKIAGLSRCFPDNKPLSFREIIAVIFNTFSCEQKMVVQTAAMLGDIFERSLLVQLLKKNCLQKLSGILEELFEQNIFSCGSKYYSSASASHVLCHCEHTLGSSVQCQLIYFKHSCMKSVALQLLPAKTVRDFHLKTVEILERQSGICVNCRNRNFGPLLNLDYYQENFSASTDESGKTMVPQSEKRRNFMGQSVCFCLEFLLKSSIDLARLSELAGCAKKQLYCLLNYAKLLVKIGDNQRAIQCLTSASALCDRQSQEYFRKTTTFSVQILLAQAYLGVLDLRSARNQTIGCLEMCRSKKKPRTRFKAFFATSKKYDSVPDKIDLPNFAALMQVCSILLFKAGFNGHAQLASARSLLGFDNFNVELCEIYLQAIEVNAFCGNFDTSEMLFRRIIRKFLTNYPSNYIYFYAISRLICLVFKVRAFQGLLSKAIKTGYKALDVIMLTHSVFSLAEVLPVLCTLLLMTQRINEAVQVAKILRGAAQFADFKCLIGYWAFCVELYTDTGFLLEPIEAIEAFSEDHFDKNPNKHVDIKQKLIVYLYACSLRSYRVQRALFWKNLLDPPMESPKTIVEALNLLKRTECILLTLVRNFEVANVDCPEIKEAKYLLGICEMSANIWPLFKPRLLHLKAYFSRINGQKNRSKDYLEEAFGVAENHGNILEQCWLNLNNNVWNGGLTFGTVKVRKISWKNAKTYTPIQWSQIMYGLPLS